MSTAISLAAVVAGGLAAYAWWGMRAVAAGANILWVLAGVPLAFLAVPAIFGVFWFTLAWFFRAPRPLAARLGPGGFALLYLREVLAILGSVPRMIGYAVLMRDPAASSVPNPAAMPVLLLHGVLCNAGVWHPMKKYLAAHRIGPIYALSYGPPLASIDLFAEQTSQKIDAMLAATGARQVVIVGHSMGGLVARAYLHRYGGSKVRRVITIGTPHQGSVHAFMFPGTSLSQLRPGNAWLKALGAAPSRVEPQFVSLWSWHDSMVAPQTSSVLESAENVALVGVGHNALLTDPVVFARVAAEIDRAGHRLPPLPGTTESAEEHIAAV